MKKVKRIKKEKPHPTDYWKLCWIKYRHKESYQTLLAFLIFLVLTLIYFFPVIFSNKTYSSPDSQAAYSLSKPLMKYQEKTSKMPLWSPYIFCGMPSFGSSMYAPGVYMPGLVFPKISSNLFAILHYVLAGLGIFLFLRRKKIEFLPSLLSGIAFMFTPYIIAMFTQGHGSQMMTAAYIPLALWAMDRLIEKVSLLNIGLLGLVLGFQFQRGHVQISYYILLFISLYAIFRLVQEVVRKDFKSIARQLIGLTSGFALALGLAAVLYLPILEYKPYSIRGQASVLSPDKGVGLEYATQFSFSPSEMLTFLVPSAWGFGGETYYGSLTFTDYPNYSGILVLILAIFGAIAERKKNPLLVLFFFTTIVWSLGLSFGGDFFKLFFNNFPYWSSFRVPAMILILSLVSIAILAGFGLSKLVSDREALAIRLHDRRMYLIAIVAMLFIAAMIWTNRHDAAVSFMQGFYPKSFDAYTKYRAFEALYKDIWAFVFLIAAGISLLLLMLSKKISANVFIALVCVLTVIDLWRVDKKIGQLFPEIKQADKADALTNFFKSDTTIFRIYPIGRLFGELSWPAWGVETVGGYHAAKLRLYQDFIEVMGNMPQHIVDMLNVKYALVLDKNKITIYANDTALSRAYLVGDYIAEFDPKSALATMRMGFDFKNRVLLAEEPAFYPLPDSTARATLLKSDYGLDHIKISVSNRKPQFLVLTDGYYPVGWQAYVDGVPVKTYQANYAFRAVFVPANSRLVEFKYISKVYSIGKLISYATLFLALALVAVEPIRNIRKRDLK